VPVLTVCNQRPVRPKARLKAELRTVWRCLHA
jgi:hypothetical protein